MPTDGTPTDLLGLLGRLDPDDVERVTVHSPDLDEVFLALTGSPHHAATSPTRCATRW